MSRRVDHRREMHQPVVMNLSPASSCSICNKPVPADGCYCPHCGYCLGLASKARSLGESVTAAHAVGSGHQMGRYELIRRIGRGGMGEVFLAWDPTALRYVALKRIQPELSQRNILYKRFLKEAWLTSRLAHPGVVPIYSVHLEDNQLYYTMPYIRGRTLKEILRAARRTERDPVRASDPSHSIQSLMRVFVTVSQVIAYAHSQGILHRDVKPENVMVGDFGEVYLLDWGLAKAIGDVRPDEGEDVDEGSPKNLTLPGKVFGTIAYLAPERALGHMATELSDIYSLGVVLYQLLCLRLPFKRGTIREFVRNMHREVLVSAAKRAPYRNVPDMLERIACRCLQPRATDRYQSVLELVHDVENFLEGRSEWFHLADLNLLCKEDWEFQENVYLSRDIALTGAAEVTEWVTLMVSKASFSGNLRLTARVKIGTKGAGIGLLLSIPQPSLRQLPDIGYCLWLGAEARSGSKLIRSSVDVLDAPDVYLKRGHEHLLRIEKIENNLFFYLDDERRFTYISYLPLSGTHIGVMVRDADLEVSDLAVEVGSYSIKVNCLAVPDAFLANHDYNRALAEYRRIGASFPQRDEGREAKFRAGITLLEQAKNGSDPAAYDLALTEFQTLHSTAGAPLEYLGKSLVYSSLEDNEEEVKCFQLAFRRYRQHPLLPVLKEQVTYRMHESSRKDRWAAYRFMLLCAQLLPDVWERPSTRRLVDRLTRHWELLSFFVPLSAEERRDRLYRQSIAVQLAFWLNQPLTLGELAEELTLRPIANTCLCHALIALIQLGHWEQAAVWIMEASDATTQELRPLIILHQDSLEQAIQALPPHPKSPILMILMQACLDVNRPDLALHLRNLAPEHAHLVPHVRVELDALAIWANLLADNYREALVRLDRYPLEMLSMETSLLHPLFGCALAAMEGESIAMLHFSGVLETPYPRTYALLGHYLSDVRKRNQEWLQRLFYWEKLQLYRQLALYYQVTGDLTASHSYRKLANGLISGDSS